MTDDIATDQRLAALLNVPPRPADRLFALRVRTAVLAEQQMRAARRSTWVRFVAETAASCAVILAFMLLGGYASEAAASPSLIGALIVGLWMMVGLPARAKGKMPEGL